LLNLLLEFNPPNFHQQPAHDEGDRENEDGQVNVGFNVSLEEEEFLELLAPAGQAQGHESDNAQGYQEEKYFFPKNQGADEFVTVQVIVKLKAKLVLKVNFLPRRHASGSCTWR
jgi:hypothetical protein